MSLGLPTHLEPVSISRAFARSSHIVALVCLLSAIVCLVAIQFSFPTLMLWPLVIALLPMLLLLWLTNWLATPATAALYLGLGGPALYCYTLAGTTEFPGTTTDSLLLTLPKIALVMVGRPRVGSWSAVLWCLAGFAVAEGVTVLAATQTGAIVVLDATSTLTTLVIASILAFIAVYGLALQPAKPTLLRAARDEHLSALRAHVEARAAAVLHDTVLDHLAAITSAPVGALSPALREQVARDLEVIVGEEWLTEVQAEQSLHLERFETTRFARVIERAPRLGLEVDVSGDILAIERLTPTRATAVALATQQCLSNVARHAGVSKVEIVVFGSEQDVSVLVVDAGRGFVVGAPRRDRLGLSHSIQHRIEAVGGIVQIWSTPGRGTTVLLRVPADTSRAIGTGVIV